MKRILSIFILSLYLAASIGVTISLHYCGESLADISLIDTPSCCCDEEPSNSDCCSDEIQSIKLHEAHNKSEHPYHFDLVFLNEMPIRHEFAISKRNNFTDNYASASLPPPPDINQDVKIYKHIHSYLFYS